MRTKEQHCESQRKYKATHLEEQRASYRNWYRANGKQRVLAIKAEVLTHYGKGKLACVMCGESRLACLTLDHIDGGGYQERKEKRWHGFGHLLYLRLKKEGYPKGFQTLCMNCQFCKAFLDRSFNKVHERKPK